MARGSGLVMIRDTLTPGVRAFPDKLDRQVATLVDFYGPRAEAYMRSRATWKDRTGNARNGLRAEPEHNAGEHVIWVSHSIPYGIWLEVRFNGRYAIIVKTVRAIGRELMVSFRGLVGRMR